MFKSDLILRVARRAGISNADAAFVVNAMTEEIAGALVEGRSVSIMGFGVFSVTRRTQRMGVNPRNGEAIVIAPRISARFSPCKALKDQIHAANGGGE